MMLPTRASGASDKLRRYRVVGEYLLTGYTLNARPLEEGTLVKSLSGEHQR